MISNVDKLKALSPCIRHRLINYVIGLPNDLRETILIHINDDFMNPELIMGNDRHISIYSIIAKYIDKNKYNIHMIDNGSRSDYQSDYCRICEKIYDPKTRNILGSLFSCYMGVLDAPSYNAESFIKIEKDVASVLSDYTRKDMRNSHIGNILSTIDILNEDIMGYKAKVYDAYSNYILASETGMTDADIDTSFMTHIMYCINRGISQDESGYADQHDLAGFIYKYLLMLGIEKGFEAWNLFERFKYGMIAHNKNDEFITGVYENILEMINDGLDTRSTSSDLVYPEKYEDIFSPVDTIVNNYDVPDSPIVFNSNGMVFFNVEEYIDNSEWLSNELRKLNKQMISEYLPKTDNLNISFTLSDNDFGNLSNIHNIKIGSAYDKFNNKMHRIISYNGNWYLLFKSNTHPASILGLGINPMDSAGTRELLSLKRDVSCTYKYIPNI